MSYKDMKSFVAETAVTLALLQSVVSQWNQVDDVASQLEVVCGSDRMTVHLTFASPFHGVVFSKGSYGQEKCIYVHRNSGVTRVDFDIHYDQCGTKPDLRGSFYENTVIIQYGTDVIEARDEAKRLRCEWHDNYEKPASKPSIKISDLEVVELNFQGDDIDCWMEIQEGKGPWARHVSDLVSLGSPMTMVIATSSHFDMRVKSCYAHGRQPHSAIYLTDEHGCVLRPKMMTPFQKVRDYSGQSTVVAYSHFNAFKFPDAIDVYIRCTVEVCRHGCLDSCQQPSPEYSALESKAVPREENPSLANMSHKFEAQAKYFGPAVPHTLSSLLQTPSSVGETTMGVPQPEPQWPFLNKPYPYPRPHFPPPPLGMGHIADRMDTFPVGPRALRHRRNSEREFGVQQSYKVVAPSDLAFDITDRPIVYQGQREENLEAVCVPVVGLAVGLGLLLLTAASTVALLLAWLFGTRRRQSHTRPKL